MNKSIKTKSQAKRIDRNTGDLVSLRFIRNHYNITNEEQLLYFISEAKTAEKLYRRLCRKGIDPMSMIQ